MRIKCSIAYFNYCKCKFLNVILDVQLVLEIKMGNVCHANKIIYYGARITAVLKANCFSMTIKHVDAFLDYLMIEIV